MKSEPVFMRSVSRSSLDRVAPLRLRLPTLTGQALLAGYLAYSALLILPSVVAGQDLAEEQIRVHVECRSPYCDAVRQLPGISFANPVGSAEQAQVLIIIEGARAADGGFTYTLEFLGRENLTGNDRTRSLTTTSDRSEEEIGEALLFAVERGLVEYRVLQLVSAPESAGLELEERLRVFLDCESCDFDHVRREIPFVDYVRNREDAQVHVIVTTQRTGSWGHEYTLEYIGRQDLAGVVDTLRATSSQTDTDDEERALLTNTLAIGLAHLAARIGLANSVRIQHEEPSREGLGNQVTSDPWNYWVFRLGMGGSFDAQESTSYLSLDGTASANRTTEAWKLNIRLSGSYGRSEYTLNDGEDLISEIESYEGDLLLVKSLSDHWSLGGRGAAAASTYRNVDFTARLAPAIEFNVFPYAETTRRQFRFQYSVGIQNFDYIETTIFDQTQETLWNQVLTVYFDTTQPWGTANLALEGSAYLHDLSKNRFELYGGLDIRLVRGLSLSLYGSTSRIRDQLNLTRDGATDEEILLRLKELETSFDYSMFVGLSFTFGSIFNNVVNPRFTG